jgi:hypothetical protein
VVAWILDLVESQHLVQSTHIRGITEASVLLNAPIYRGRNDRGCGIILLPSSVVLRAGDGSKGTLSYGRMIA